MQGIIFRLLFKYLNFLVIKVQEKVTSDLPIKRNQKLILVIFGVPDFLERAINIIKKFESASTQQHGTPFLWLHNHMTQVFLHVKVGIAPSNIVEDNVCGVRPCAVLEFFTVKKLFATSSNISHPLDAVKFPVVARYNQIKSVFHSNSHSGATKDPQITHPQNAIFI